MAIYKHKETGTVIITDSELAGDWILADEGQEDDLTVPELKSLLTDLGVPFEPKAKKSELLALYEANKVD